MQNAPAQKWSPTLDLCFIGGTPLLLLFLIVPGFLWGGAFYILPAFFAFALVPVLDAVLPLSQDTQRKEDLSPFTHQALSFVPIVYTFLFLVLFTIQIFKLNTLSSIEIVLAVFSFSAMGAEERRQELSAQFDQIKPHRYVRRRPNGQYIEIIGRPMPEGGLVATYTDITQQKAAQDEIERLAWTDNLTGLFNRNVYRSEIMDIMGERQWQQRTPTGEAMVMGLRRTGYTVLYCCFQPATPTLSKIYRLKNER